MNKYEFTYLISPNISGHEIEEYTEKIKGIVTEQGGSLILEKEPTKRSLGDVIDKKNEAYLKIFEFSISKEGINILKKEAEDNKNVLRLMVLRKHPISEKKRARTRAKKEEKRDKVELENIDDKIDEILQ